MIKKLLGFKKKPVAKADADVTGGMISEVRGLSSQIARLQGKISDRETQEIIDAIMGSAPEQEVVIAVDQTATPGGNIMVNKNAIVEHNGATIKAELVGLTRLDDGTVTSDLSEIVAQCQGRCRTLIKGSQITSGEAVRSDVSGRMLCARCKRKHPYLEKQFVAADELEVIEDNIWLRREAEFERKKREKLMRKLHDVEMKKLLNSQQKTHSEDSDE